MLRGVNPVFLSLWSSARIQLYVRGFPEINSPELQFHASAREMMAKGINLL